MFSYIANHLWQSTLFAGGIGVLCVSLRKEGAHVRYWLWWVASAKFLVPFAVLVQIGSSLAPDATPFMFSEGWVSTAGAITAPIDQSGLPMWLRAMLIAVWVVGFAAYIIRWRAHATQIRQVLGRAKHTRTVKIGDQAVAMYCSHDAREPSIVGLFKPVFLVPQRIDEILSGQQLAAVSAHELCHARRRDNLTAVSQMIVETVFWFFPVVWIIGARMVVERERACDEAVVAQGYCRESYAEGILNVCEHFAKSPLVSSAGVSGGNLNERIKHILRSKVMNKLGGIKKTLLTTTAALVVAIPVLFGFAVQASEEPDIDVLPIERTPPTYPPEALAQGLNGHVDLEFTITEQGTTEDIKVLVSTSPIFEESAIQALAKFKYEPMNSPIPKARIRIAFLLENDEESQADREGTSITAAEAPIS